MSQYRCEKHPQHDHGGEPHEKHYVLCSWCAQDQRRQEYVKQKLENTMRMQNAQTSLRTTQPIPVVRTSS